MRANKACPARDENLHRIKGNAPQRYRAFAAARLNLYLCATKLGNRQTNCASLRLFIHRTYTGLQYNIAMNLRQQFDYFIAAHKTAAWLLIAMLGGALLQLVVFGVSGFAGKPAIYEGYYEYLTLPSSLKLLLFRPWTLLTYPFIVPKWTNAPLYLLFSGLMMWTFAKVFQQIIGDAHMRRVALLSIPMAGLLGAIIAQYALPQAHNIAGINVLTATLLMATISLVPSYPVTMFLFGEVKVVFVGAVILVLMLVSVNSLDSSLGITIAVGAALGGTHIYFLRKRGKDYTETIWDALSRIFPRKNPQREPRMKVRQGGAYNSSNTERFRETTPSPNSYTRPLTYDSATEAEDIVPQEVVDKILDKINASGYDSLSRKEKELLFRASQQKNDSRR